MRRLLAAAAALAISAVPARAAVARFRTRDRWTIVADYRPAAKGRPVAILVHGVAANHEEWGPLEAALRARGYGSLALDLRGHGDSTSGPAGRRTYQDFDAAGEWPKAAEDILAAARFLERRGVAQDRLVLIGGSIGANLCAQAFAALPKARALALLSPGIDYRGVRLPRFDPARTILAASRGDAYAYATVQRAREVLPGVAVIAAEAGHGAQMLADPKFAQALLDAVDARAK